MVTATAAKWALRGRGYEYCNCDFGCGCNFGGFPNSKDGSCRALVGMEITSGSAGDVDLSGVTCAAVVDWPKAIHEGNGKCAFVVDPATTDPMTLHKGIELVEQKVLKALTAAGLEIINPIDQTFDPTQHEAVSTEAALSEEDDHTVAKVFQSGYRFNGQLLRPARVVVKQWNG